MKLVIKQSIYLWSSLGLIAENFVKRLVDAPQDGVDISLSPLHPWPQLRAELEVGLASARPRYDEVIIVVFELSLVDVLAQVLMTASEIMKVSVLILGNAVLQIRSIGEFFQNLEVSVKNRIYVYALCVDFAQLFAETISHPVFIFKPQIHRHFNYLTQGEKKHRIVSAGRLAPGKNYLRSLEVIERVLTTDGEASAIFIGDWDYHNQGLFFDEKTRYQERVRDYMHFAQAIQRMKYAFNDRFIVSSFLDPFELDVTLAQSKVFISLSEFDFEDFNITAHQAALAGCDLALSFFGGHKDLKRLANRVLFYDNTKSIDLFVGGILDLLKTNKVWETQTLTKVSDYFSNNWPPCLPQGRPITNLEQLLARLRIEGGYG